MERVRQALSARHMEDRIQTFDVSSATVPLAAQALGCEAARIAKTLSFASASGALLIVCAGDARVDNAKFKHLFGEKARMIPAGEVEATVGYAVGGVCPFAVNDGVRIYLDESLKRFDTVYPAAGSASSAVRLTWEELEQITQGTWVDVCKTEQAEKAVAG